MSAPEHIVFITGKLAHARLEKVARTLPPERFRELLELMQQSDAAHGLIARAANRTPAAQPPVLTAAPAPRPSPPPLPIPPPQLTVDNPGAQPRADAAAGRDQGDFGAHLESLSTRMNRQLPAPSDRRSRRRGK